MGNSANQRSTIYKKIVMSVFSTSTNPNNFNDVKIVFFFYFIWTLFSLLLPFCTFPDDDSKSKAKNWELKFLLFYIWISGINNKHFRHSIFYLFKSIYGIELWEWRSNIVFSLTICIFLSNFFRNKDHEEWDMDWGFKKLFSSSALFTYRGPQEEGKNE